MARFTDLPNRLRRIRDQMADAGHVPDIGDWLVLSGTLEDAALKIEALERVTRLDAPSAPEQKYECARCKGSGFEPAVGDAPRDELARLKSSLRNIDSAMNAGDAVLATAMLSELVKSLENEAT